MERTDHTTHQHTPHTHLRRPVAVLLDGVLEGYIPRQRAEENLLLAKGLGWPVHERTTTTRDGRTLTVQQFTDQHGDQITYLIDPRPISPSLVHGLLLALASHIERTDNGRPIGSIQRIAAIRAVADDDTPEQCLLREVAPPAGWEPRASYAARLREMAEAL